MIKRTIASSIVLVACLLALSLTAYGLPILPYTTTPGGDGLGTWTLENTDGEGVTRKAEASFSIANNTLSIVLTNTAAETKQPNQVLTGIFFDFSGELSGSPDVNKESLSQVLDADGNEISVTDLNGEFGYLVGLNALNDGRGDYGVCSSSLDPLGFPRIAEDPLYDPSSLNGADFGLVGDIYSGNGGQNPIAYYVQSAVSIDWVISNSGDVGNVHFIYGTDYAPVPEPCTMLLLGTGLVGFVGFRKKFKK